MENTVKIGDKTYKLVELTFGELNDIDNAASVVDPKTGMQLFKIGTLRTETILRGARLIDKNSRERKLTHSEIRAMKGSEGLTLYNKIREFNQIPLGT